MPFIDASYFVGNLNIPNTDQQAVAEALSLFILKYEPEFLQKLLGYPLYKAFINGMNVVAPATPAQRYLDILYGKEYTDLNGNLAKWQGLIITDSPTVNLSGNLVYKIPVTITTGITQGFVSGTNNATFADWIGWTPIITRSSPIPLKVGVDYSYDITIGKITLLKPNDVFGVSEDLYVQFVLRTDSLPILGMTQNQSCIANYIYYWFRRNNVSQHSGIGEVIAKAEGSTNISPRHKMASAWNEMQRWARDFLRFMEATQNADATIYPEWNFQNRIDAYEYFRFINPIF